MSPYLRELVVLMGCEHVYSDVPPLIERLLRIKVSTSGVFRSCMSVAERIDSKLAFAPGDELAKSLGNPDATAYGYVDGSMVQTEDGWQEVKLGRAVYLDMLHATERSEYVAHRGHFKDFAAKFERLFPPESKCRQVFITDGAQWINNWLSSSYPSGILILDFWHVVEKLGAIAQHYSLTDTWLHEQKARLLESSLDIVLMGLRELKESKELDKALGYLEGNRDRMDYKRYREMGLRIGSGPIESAHRTVLQVRMKRSGQRWTNEGADNMVKLRAIYKSNKLHLINSAIKAVA